MNDYSAEAELIAFGVVLAITLLLLIGRRAVVATQDFSFTPPEGVLQTVKIGAIVPSAALASAPAGSTKKVYLPFLRQLIVGKDNRMSTSKAVALAWTYALFFGLLSLIVAKWLGNSVGYDKLVENGLQEEYLLLLGGPYAAAAIAKYNVVSQSQGQSGKPIAPVGEASAKQLVTDDEGDMDLGDFQYVLFNLLALVFLLGTFLPHLQEGLPQLPAVLTGLALTSAGGYAAKQLVQQAGPTLTSLLPSSVAHGASPPAKVEVWGQNLIVPAGVAPGGAALAPTVTVDGLMATVTASEQVLGADHITVELPSTAVAGEGKKLRAIRADGVAATGLGGIDGLGLTIT
jgi:hypothetical protein